MVAAFSVSRLAILGSGDALWRACRRRASFHHWQPSLVHSASVHRALAERQPEPTPTELRGSPAKELRKTRRARSPDIVSTPTDVPLREDSHLPPNSKRTGPFPRFPGYGRRVQCGNGTDRHRVALKIKAATNIARRSGTRWSSFYLVVRCGKIKAFTTAECLPRSAASR
jgi:hypothetical protein